MEEKERRNYKVIIQEAINGFIVEVGCVKPIVFISWEALKKELEAFYQGKETKLAKKVMKTSRENCPTQAADCAITLSNITIGNEE